MILIIIIRIYPLGTLTNLWKSICSFRDISVWTNVVDKLTFLS